MIRLNHKFRIFLLAALAASFFGMLSLKTRAATPSGITVSPAFQQVSIPQGQASVPIKFTVTNHQTKTQTIKLGTQDFNTLGETGGLVFVGSNPTELQKKYGLAKWVELPQTRLTIQPNQTATVNASVLNLSTLNPGGHYGALMLALNDSGQSNNSVVLHPIASSLLFVTKLGGDTHRLGLAGVESKHNIFNLPGNVTLRFQNAGNTHVIPRGIVTLSDPKGHIVKKGIINQDSNIILPETVRKLSVPLQTISTSHLPGSYTIKVDFRFDGFSQYREYKQGFINIPVVVVIIVLALLVMAFYWALRLLGHKRNKT
jgi:hypothetical protein